ncbi:MAG: pyrroline-5-carboxylate reductase [Candidatus Omnitrophota bacterium]
MIGIIGAGNMGKAIALRLDKKTIVSDVAMSRLKALKNRRILTTMDNIELSRRSRVVILAVKPKDITAVLKEIKPYITGQLVISIAAGIKTSLIENALGRARVVRVMPNMPALVGRGISAISAGRFALRKDLAAAHSIFRKLGDAIEIKESLMDAVTAVSGSGPAYYFLFTELLKKAGIKAGLKEGLARKLALATFIGAAESARLSNISMRDFIKRVASKGGTTEAALETFKNMGLQRIIERAVKAACDKSRSFKGMIDKGGVR